MGGQKPEELSVEEFEVEEMLHQGIQTEKVFKRKILIPNLIFHTTMHLAGIYGTYLFFFVATYKTVLWSKFYKNKKNICMYFSLLIFFVYSNDSLFIYINNFLLFPQVFYLLIWQDGELLLVLIVDMPIVVLKQQQPFEFCWAFGKWWPGKYVEKKMNK